MQDSSKKILIDLNLNFYKQVATSFDSSRNFFWPGWEKLSPYLENLSENRNSDSLAVLDLACGNGRFAKWLAENEAIKNRLENCSYLGLDSDKFLLSKARQMELPFPADFALVDLLAENCQSIDLALAEKKFDLIAVLGFLHHVPSFELRVKLLEIMAKHLTDNGLLVVTAWQFLDIATHRNRAIPLDETDLIPDPESGDYILDWQRGTHARRYCHLLEQSEIEKILKESRLKCIESFRADGSDQSNLYLILTKS